MSMKTKLLSILALVALLGCDNGIKPASLDEIVQATCILHDGLGQGVLVGFNDMPTERVFLLTARHVATFNGAPKNEVHVRIANQCPMTITNSYNRWLTAKPGLDVAWIELNADEIASLRNKNSLKYIAITNGPNAIANKGILGTNANGFEDIIKAKRSSSSAVTLFFRNAQLDAVAENRIYDDGQFQSDYNNVYKIVRSRFVGAIASVNTPRGESGGAVAAKVKYGSTDYWVLGGVIIGGRDNPPTHCAIAPIGETLMEMRYCNRLLKDYPELW